MNYMLSNKTESAIRWLAIVWTINAIFDMLRDLSLWFSGRW